MECARVDPLAVRMPFDLVRVVDALTSKETRVQTIKVVRYVIAVAELRTST
jgi:hypothetical protein